MPLFDFKCPSCGAVREQLFKAYAEMEVTVVRCACGATMTKQIAMPAAFKVTGFNAHNHYGAKEMTKTTRVGPPGRGMRITATEGQG